MNLQDILKDKDKDYEVEKCYKCGHICGKGTMKRILIGNDIFGGKVRGAWTSTNSDPWHHEPPKERFYCELCKPNYDFILLEASGYGSPYHEAYCNWVTPYKRVNEKGEDLIWVEPKSAGQYGKYITKDELAIEETKRCQKGNCQNPAYTANHFCKKHIKSSK